VGASGLRELRGLRELQVEPPPGAARSHQQPNFIFFFASSREWFSHAGFFLNFLPIIDTTGTSIPHREKVVSFRPQWGIKDNTPWGFETWCVPGRNARAMRIS
jgi:hypothetical protein